MVTLRAVSRGQGNNAALKAGRVTVPGVTLDWVEVDPLIKAFRQMVRGLEYDVCEMALTTYVCAREHGVRFTAIPVFLVRGFHHGAIMVNAKNRPASPKALEGQRVGVNRGYTVTTGVWARDVLAREHGVDLSKVTWVLTGDEHVASYRAPGNVVPMGEGSGMEERLLSGDLAAAIGLDSRHPDIVPLIDDPEAAGLAAMRATGVWPINHLIAVRDDVLSANPGLGAALFHAFAESKRRYVDDLRAGRIAAPTAVDRLHASVMAAMGGDPLPYGLAPNRATLTALLDTALAQGIVTRRPDLEALFAPETLSLAG